MTQSGHHIKIQFLVPTMLVIYIFTINILMELLTEKPFQSSITSTLSRDKIGTFDKNLTVIPLKVLIGK